MVRLAKTDLGFIVSVPYHPQFPQRARNLGGKWNSVAKEWRFDIRDAMRVEALCDEIYGYRDTDLITVQVDLVKCKVEVYDGALWLFGRQIARRFYRDDWVRLGDGVILVKGYFPKVGPLDAGPDTVVEIRDVPRSLVKLRTGMSIVVPGSVGPDPARKFRLDGSDETI